MFYSIENIGGAVYRNGQEPLPEWVDGSAEAWEECFGRELESKISGLEIFITDTDYVDDESRQVEPTVHIVTGRLCRPEDANQIYGLVDRVAMGHVDLELNGDQASHQA